MVKYFLSIFFLRAQVLKQILKVFFDFKTNISMGVSDLNIVTGKKTDFILLPILEYWRFLKNVLFWQRSKTILFFCRLSKKLK